MRLGGFPGPREGGGRSGVVVDRLCSGRPGVEEMWPLVVIEA